MGAVLAMKWLSLAACLTAASCGTLYDANPIAGAAQGFVSGGGDATPTASVADTINRDFIEAQASNLLLVSIINRDAVAVVFQAGQNRGTTTWLSPDGISISLTEGFITATRGLGGDIMATDSAGSRSGFAGVGPYSKVYEYLDGRDQIVTDRFSCEMQVERRETITIYDRSYNTTVFEEFCESAEFLIRNVYWRDQNGTIWQSRQWISADVGYLGYQRL